MDNDFKFLIDAGLDDDAKQHVQTDIDKKLKGLKATIEQLNLDPKAAQALQNALQQNGINLNITVRQQQIQQAQKAGQQIGQQISHGVQTAIQKGKFKQNFTVGQLGLNQVAQDAKREFEKLGVGIVTVHENMKKLSNGDAYLNDFVVAIKRADGIIESLNYKLENGVFKYTSGTINDQGVIKQFSAITNTLSQYKQKFEQFKSTNRDILSGLSQPIQNFEQELLNLENGVGSINKVKNAYHELSTEASKITGQLTGQLGKTASAARNLAIGEQTIDKLKTDFKGLSNAPKEVATQLNGLSTKLQEIQTIEANEGRTVNWATKYTEWKSELDAVTAKIRVLQKEQSKLTSNQVLTTADLKKADRAYLTKVNSGVSNNSKEVAKMAKAHGWTDWDITGVEKADGMVKKLTVTFTDAEGAMKRFVMQRDKIDTGNRVYNGLVQIGDVQVIQSATVAYQEQLQIVEKIRQLSSNTTKNNYATQISSLEGDFRKIGVSVDDAAKKLDKTKIAFDHLQTELNKPVSEQNFSEIIRLNDVLQTELNASTAEYQQMQAEAKGFVNMQRRLSLANTIEAWNQKNTKATKAVIQSNNAYIASLRALNSQMSKLDFDEINRGFKNNEISMRSLHRLGASLTDQFKQAANSFTQWISVSSAVMGLVYQIKKMPQATSELDAAITDFTMATGANEAQIKSLMKAYGELGDEMRATITDVTISATEWLKQGQSLVDTETLVSNAMVLSKIGALSSTDATKYLTSAMKGYKVAVEDTLDVVDKLSAVDMASATDVGGLAEAMSGVAASAELAGVSMDKLLGYAAVIGEVTQQGMSETGTTLNAVFARMGNIKLARLKDYQNSEGVDLSNVETVLRGVGINLRDSSNSFRDFDEVLDETASRWNNFSEVQQRAVAQAFAGTHHLNEFVILMENYNTALKYAGISAESSGEAMQKFAAYEESIVGHTERLRNEFILLSSDLASSDLIKSFIDLGTVGVKGIHGLVEEFGLLGNIGLFSGLITGVKNVGRDKMSSLKRICRQQYSSYTKYKFRYCAL